MNTYLNSKNAPTQLTGAFQAVTQIPQAPTANRSGATVAPTGASSLARRTIIGGVARGAEAVSVSKQDVHLARDASPSMDEDAKAPWATEATSALVHELNDPINKGAFNISARDFAIQVEQISPLVPSAVLDGAVPAVQPGALGGLTNIHAPLEEIAREIQAKAPYHVPPVAVLYTDGNHNEGPDPTAPAAIIKRYGTLIVVGFGDDADESLGQQLASPGCYFHARDGASLRDIFYKVGHTLSVIRRAGGNQAQLAQSLSHIPNT